MAEDKSVKEGLRIFKLIGYTLVFIAGTLLNILLFFAVTRKRIRHNNTSKTFITLMQNLAVADVLLLVLNIPFDAAWHEVINMIIYYLMILNILKYFRYNAQADWLHDYHV